MTNKEKNKNFYEWALKMFNEHYVPKIDVHIEKGCYFIMGGAPGIDRMAIEYLIEKYDKKKICICVPEEEDNDVKNFLNKLKCDVKELKGYFNHFKNEMIKNKKKSKFLIRDEFMTKNSNDDIAFLIQYGGSGSATALNLYRRAFGQKKAAKIKNIIINNSLPYDPKERDKCFN